MKNVGDQQAVLETDAVGRGQYFRQARARNDRILQHEVWRETTHCAKRALACGPKTFALAFVSRAADAARSAGKANAFGPRRFFV